MTTSLCPTNGCQAVSHLRCLSRLFLETENQGTTVIPRGGSCPICRSYVLWGDVVKGCYRRYAGKAIQEDDDEDDEDVGEPSSASDDEDDTAAADALEPLQSQNKVVKVARKKSARRMKEKGLSSASEEPVPRKGRYDSSPRYMPSQDYIAHMIPFSQVALQNRPIPVKQARSD